VEFYAKEIAAHAVYDVSVFLQNDDGLGDPDVRRKRIGTDWVAAQSQPIQRQVTATVDRHFLNEDWQLVLVGDTTDEWKAEVVLNPLVLPAETKGTSNIIRYEFAP
jgi:hypothetical protein